MSDTTQKNSLDNNSSGQIDIEELFSVLWGGKIIIILLTLCTSTLAIMYSLSLPNIYKSEAIVISTSSTQSGQAFQSYSGLASLAGIDINSSAEVDQSKEAIKKISSLSFFTDHIYSNIFLPDLMAIESWNPKDNIINYDRDIYDSVNNVWIRKGDSQPPTFQESYIVFKGLFSVYEDSDDGFYRISIEHKSPHVASEWVKLILAKIDEYMRANDRDESIRAVKYLNEQMSRTQFAEIKQALAMLIQNETQKLTLLESKRGYVFKYIDPPVASELKHKPNRALICIFGSIIGFVIGIFITLFNHIKSNKLY